MAFRFRLVLAACLVFVGVGCRKPLAPSADSNAAPETWITAAPQDTITVRNNSGTVIDPAVIGTIAFRFHLYWAGSDQDGEVRGFYWAVTETVKTPGIDIEPPLPAPKPSDYRYTSRTDSTFIFNVLEETRTRRHAFYLYAVDNEGKVDPTPARFVFDALDRFPPFAVFTESYADGWYRDPANPNGPSVYRRFALSDTFLRGRPAPNDTVPIGSRLLFRWRGQETIAGNPAVSYKYKFDTPAFVTADPGVDSVAFGSNRSGEGQQLFEVRAVDVAGASRTDIPTTRWFVSNFTPDTWFSGPALTTSFNSDNWGTTAAPFRDGQRFRELPNWNTVPAFQQSLMGPDSGQVLPKDRPRRKTFFEIYRNRIFYRAENDTVNLNSWVLFFGGGFDADSPYRTRVDGFRMDTTANPVYRKGEANGSPVALRLYVPVKLFPGGTVGGAPLSPAFPVDETATAPEVHVGGYVGMQQSGRAYALLRAVDGNGRMDDRIANPVGFVDSVEAGIPMPAARAALRDRVLTFYVNRAPYLETWSNSFQPVGPWQFTGNPPQPRDTIATYPTREITFGTGWALLSKDQDPYDPAQREVGGPPLGTTPQQRFRYTLSLRGRTLAGNDTIYRPTLPTLYRTDVPPTSIAVPGYFRGPDLTLDVELCDYPTFDFIAGQGRCRYYSFPVRVPAASPHTVAPLRARSNVKTGPGNPRSTDGGLN